MGFLDIFKKKSEINNTIDTKDRYMLEHHILPHFILGENGGKVINCILNEKGGFFVDLYTQMNAKEANYRCSYTIGQYQVNGIRFECYNDLYALEIQMPEPEKDTLCKSIFIVHDSKLKNRRYITIEKASNVYFICEWTADGVHHDYGNYSSDKLLKIISNQAR